VSFSLWLMKRGFLLIWVDKNMTSLSRDRPIVCALFSLLRRLRCGEPGRWGHMIERIRNLVARVIL
jgi:hypothetical protein